MAYWGVAMNRYDRLTVDPRFDSAETGTSIDALIRPCLRQAFQLPADDLSKDERFSLLLDALALRARGQG
jgi:hypothetical protein